MRMIIALCLLASAASAATTNRMPVFAAERWIKAESETETVWIDKMTDGTFRESVTKKQPTVIRARLVATNDVDFAWRMDYEATLSDGSVVTNAAFRAKPPKTQLNDKIGTMTRTPPPIAAQTNAAPWPKYFPRVQAAGAMADAITVKRRATNTRPVKIEPDSKGRAVATYADGRKETNEITRVVSARIPSPYEKKEVPEPTGKSAAFLLGFAAGVAAMGGAVAVKKGKE